jgi:hypothetical protein
MKIVLMALVIKLMKMKNSSHLKMTIMTHPSQTDQHHQSHEAIETLHHHHPIHTITAFDIWDLVTVMSKIFLREIENPKWIVRFCGFPVLDHPRKPDCIFTQKDFAPGTRICMKCHAYVSRHDVDYKKREKEYVHLREGRMYINLSKLLKMHFSS